MIFLKYIKKNIEYIIFFALVFMLAILILNKSWESFYNEQNGINRLDAIIYINLEDRGDRKELLMKDLEKLNTNMSKVHKVSGIFIPKNGHKGCVQSHILALNMIKLNKWKRALILEDDAEIVMPPETVNEIINKSLEKLDTHHADWNVIMLGTENKSVDTKYNDIFLDINSNQDNLKIEKVEFATTGTAYIIKDTYVDSILNLFNNCNNNMEHGKLSGDNYEHWALDQKWRDLQNNDKWFCISKDPIKQRNIWSTTMRESHA